MGNVPNMDISDYFISIVREIFDRGCEFNSHMESIWSQLKKQITSIYKMIPSEKLLNHKKRSEF